MLRYLNRGQVITIAQFGRPHNIDREPKLSESTGRFSLLPPRYPPLLLAPLTL